MYARKSIKRASQVSADAAMNRHIEAMLKRGWIVGAEFAGTCSGPNLNRGFRTARPQFFEVVCEFFKDRIVKQQRKD